MSECLGHLDREKIKKFTTTYEPLKEYMRERFPHLRGNSIEERVIRKTLGRADIEKGLTSVHRRIHGSTTIKEVSHSVSSETLYPGECYISRVCPRFDMALPMILYAGVEYCTVDCREKCPYKAVETI